MSFLSRDLSKPILDAFAIATVPACKADWETGLERFRPPNTLPDAFSWFGAGKPGFSSVLSSSLRGIGQTQKENLSGMTYHEFVLCGKFCFAFWPSGRPRPHFRRCARSVRLEAAARIPVNCEHVAGLRFLAIGCWYNLALEPEWPALTLGC